MYIVIKSGEMGESLLVEMRAVAAVQVAAGTALIVSSKTTRLLVLRRKPHGGL
jgi:hypothetical protein